MHKFAKFVPCFTLFAISGAAFAAPSAGFSPLQAVLSAAGGRFEPAVSAALDRFDAATLPAPAVSPVEARGLKLVDVTEANAQQGEVVSAYPGIYKLFHTEENSRIIRVFYFTDPAGVGRRIEVYYTGGDWMQYGLTYIATDAGLEKDRVAAYFISDLSTPDRENGAVAPAVNPFNAGQLAAFIVSGFLDAGGNVKAGFNSVASFTRRDSGWKLAQ